MSLEKLESCPRCGKALSEAYCDTQACPCGWDRMTELYAQLAADLGITTARGRWRVTCYACGGEGFGDGCTCMDDTCCCLEPTPPTCDICGGDGSYIVTELTDDNCADAVPVH